MTTTELQKQEATLRTLRQELLDSLLRREEIQIERAPDALDDLTQASARDFAVGEIERKNERLQQLEAALVRVEDGTYGVCEECENDIPIRRLNAVPWAMMCVRCQEKSEAEQQQYGPHSTRLPIGDSDSDLPLETAA